MNDKILESIGKHDSVHIEWLCQLTDEWINFWEHEYPCEEVDGAWLTRRKLAADDLELNAELVNKQAVYAHAHVGIKHRITCSIGEGEDISAAVEQFVADIRARLNPGFVKGVMHYLMGYMIEFPPSAEIIAVKAVMAMMLHPKYAVLNHTTARLIKSCRERPIKDILHYTMRMLYLDEVRYWLRLDATCRIFIPLDVAHELPRICEGVNHWQEPYNVAYYPSKTRSNFNLDMTSAIKGERGLRTLEDFRARMHIATRGLLARIEWDGRTFFNGSLLLACAAVNPLEETDGGFEQHLAARYAGADIDLMIECDTLEEFDRVAEAHIEAIRAVCDVEIERVTTRNKHKYVVRARGMSIDMYHVTDGPWVISRFHLACVRAWYDGAEVYCLPSFIVAANTGVCPDIRWISCNKDLRECLFKYARRGYGATLNRCDAIVMSEYIKARHPWAWGVQSSSYYMLNMNAMFGSEDSYPELMPEYLKYNGNRGRIPAPRKNRVLALYIS